MRERWYTESTGTWKVAPAIGEPEVCHVPCVCLAQKFKSTCVCLGKAFRMLGDDDLADEDFDRDFAEDVEQK